MRRADWASRMYAMIDAHIHTPFEWGVHDCCMFAFRVTDAMTDNARAYLIREHYHDERTARAFIDAHGGLKDSVTYFAGEPCPEGTRPHRGDMVLFDGGEGDTIGIWAGGEIVAVGETGLRRLPRSEVKVVWRG